MSPLNGSQYTYKSSPRTFNSTAPKCPSCQKSVYAAEQVLGPGGTPYHKTCLKCTVCAKILDAFNILDHNRDPYCKLCHSKTFGTRGVGYGNAVVGEYTPRAPFSSAPSSPTSPSKPSLISSPLNHSLLNQSKLSPLQSPSPNSSKLKTSNFYKNISPHSPTDITLRSSNVSADTYLISDKRWDREDFEAPTKDSGSQFPSNQALLSDIHSVIKPVGDLLLSEQRETNLEENNSQDDFQPLSMSTPLIIVKPRSKSSANVAHTHQSYPAAPKPMLTLPDELSQHPQAPFRVVARQSPISGLSSQFNSPLPPQLAPKPVLKPPLKPASLASHTAYPTSVSVMMNRAQLGMDGPKICPRCSQTVYHAEQVLAIGKKWHKRCLRCESCSKALDANMNERNGKPYCVRCYDQCFGTAAQGFVLKAGFGIS
ncbi:hypothetical protein O181_043935 [Austropuccinia psidii MF-1]|uniref:LIM zinc-binding domain-containing protein n=1 Tax=Austropuccinia psidii MF-1 TaxID=1389203 RepID=A0A9Q3HJQ1_9BASI|nr:hypothetical protein [Austropuccinia psidii MF-1]